MAREETLLQWVTEFVGRQTALLANRKNRPEFAIAPDDWGEEGVIAGYFDDGLLQLLVKAAIIKSPTDTEENTEIQPPENMGELLPFELWQALAAFVMKSWFENIGEFAIAQYWEQQYRTLSDGFRFTPNVRRVIRRTYRPLG